MVIVILPQKIGFSITACAPRPDSGHGAYAGAHRRVVFQKVLLPRRCSKLRTLFWGRSLAPFCVPFECSVIVMKEEKGNNFKRSRDYDSFVFLFGYLFLEVFFLHTVHMCV